MLKLKKFKIKTSTILANNKFELRFLKKFLEKIEKKYNFYFLEITFFNFITIFKHEKIKI